MNISIVISLYNEEESIIELNDWIKKVFSEQLKDLEYEVLFINDGSTDRSWDIIKDLSKEDNHIKAISLRRNYGKSAALFVGFEAAQGDVVITMDADLQDSPEEIPELYRMIIEEGYDLVSGWKKKRHDSLITKNIPSKLYNWASRKITGLKLHDMNCGLKAYRGLVVKHIEVYGDMHRYIPYIAKNAGFDKIGEKVITHQKRKYGKSKFGASRFFNGFLDLISISFLSRFGRKPMHIFGIGGIFFFFIGFLTSMWIVIEKLAAQGNMMKFRPVTEQPLFFISLVFLVIGSQLFLTGFLAELISRNSSQRNSYHINDKIGG